MRDFRRGLWQCQGAFALLLLASGLLAAVDRTQPPVYDSIRIAAISLFKSEHAAYEAFPGEFRRIPKAKLPLSAAAFLRPSGMVNAAHPGLRKAALEALKLLGKGATKQVLEDPALVAAAVRAFVQDKVREPAWGEGDRPFSSDPRLRIPKASDILRRGWGDEEARTRVRIALLRGLGIPARSCWFRGAPALQYWVQYFRDEDDPKAPKGEWRLDEAAFPGEVVEAWSLDPGDLSLAYWEPPQELKISLRAESAYYSLSETAQATEDMEWARENGRLPEAAKARALAPRPLSGTGKAIPYLWLQAQRLTLEAEGTLEGLTPVEVLAPYRPALKSWGKEAVPSPSKLEILSQAFWSDRPGRLKLRRGKNSAEFGDEWKSPPPAQGLLHYFSFNLRRPLPLIEASLEGGSVVGKVLREDSLAAMPGSTVKVAYESGTGTAEVLGSTDGEGKFSVELPKEAKGWITVSGGKGEANVNRWDSLRLEIRP